MHFQFIHLIYPIRRAYTLTIEPVFPVTVQRDAAYTLSIRPFSA